MATTCIALWTAFRALKLQTCADGRAAPLGGVSTAGVAALRREAAGTERGELGQRLRLLKARPFARAPRALSRASCAACSEHRSANLARNSERPASWNSFHGSVFRLWWAGTSSHLRRSPKCRRSAPGSGTRAAAPVICRLERPDAPARRQCQQAAPGNTHPHPIRRGSRCGALP
jgi:hypothetical protein